ncbi:MAG: class I SAM-dependent methyltransferase [Pseudoxanthomonas sp.]
MSQQRKNNYGRQLTEQEIAAGAHRSFVGGMWEVIGALQFEFLREKGLRQAHSLLDVGCGALRGGLHSAAYLNPGRYFGIDINASLIRAAQVELKAADLEDRNVHLLVDGEFDFARFGEAFDFAIAMSVFTHIPMNDIVRCLVNMEKVLKPEGKFYASFFESSRSAELSPLVHEPGGFVTHYDKDPFHYSFDEVRMLADLARLKVELVGDWGHPRAQRMLCFQR